MSEGRSAPLKEPQNNTKKHGGLPRNNSEVHGKRGGLPRNNSEVHGKRGGLPRNNTEVHGKRVYVSLGRSYAREVGRLVFTS